MKSNYKRLGDYIRQVDVRNKDDERYDLLGVSVEKCFISSIANTVGTDWHNYKIIKKGQFCYILDTSRRGDKIGIAHLTDREIGLVSAVYTVFEVWNKELVPEYLMLWFKRPEFDRYARYHSHGSVREIFDWEEMCNVELPVPPIEEQEKIVDAYQKIETRITLKKKINKILIDLCQTDYYNLIEELTSENLATGTIGLYCDVKSGFAFKSDWWTTDGYKVIKIANIVENSIDLEHCDYVSEENALKSKLFFVQGGDLLIAMTGATTGKIGIVPYCNDNLTVNQRVGKFFLGDDPLNKLPFLVCTLLSKSVQAQLHPDGTAGSAQDNLSADDIKNIKICLPTLNVISSFNVLHKSFFKTVIQNVAEIRSMIKLLETLLQIIVIC